MLGFIEFFRPQAGTPSPRLLHVEEIICRPWAKRGVCRVHGNPKVQRWPPQSRTPRTADWEIGPLAHAGRSTSTSATLSNASRSATIIPGKRTNGFVPLSTP